MKQIHAIIILLVAIILVLFFAVIQTNHVNTKLTTRLQTIRTIAQHEQTINPWLIIDLTGGE